MFFLMVWSLLLNLEHNTESLLSNFLEGCPVKNISEVVHISSIFY